MKTSEEAIINWIDGELAKLSNDPLRIRESVVRTVLLRCRRQFDKLTERKQKLREMSTAPRDGTYILLFGKSGYTSTPYRVEVCRYDKQYRSPWRNHANDAFTDGGSEPTGWLPLP